jgi:hypothetical protein
VLNFATLPVIRNSWPIDCSSTAEQGACHMLVMPIFGLENKFTSKHTDLFKTSRLLRLRTVLSVPILTVEAHTWNRKSVSGSSVSLKLNQSIKLLYVSIYYTKYLMGWTIGFWFLVWTHFIFIFIFLYPYRLWCPTLVPSECWRLLPATGA